jgi:hypothetical protein
MLSFILIALIIKTYLCAHLSHVIMPFHQRQVESVKDNLKLWSRYPPCRRNFSKNIQIGFIFFVSGMRNESIAQNLLDSFKSSCFSSVIIDFAELKDKNDRYLMGSRLMFEMMLSKRLNFGLIKLSHIFYMEPDALPIRPYWLEGINQQIIFPNTKFWMKGSIFRGQIQMVSMDLLYNHVHINGNSIYNLEDEKFEKFYFEIVKPFGKKFKEVGAYDTDVYRVLLWKNAKYSAELFHLFQFSDFIQNHWHSEYSLSEIRENSPNTFLVHGGQVRE